MAANYTADKTAAQAPSAAPGYGVVPVISLPADTDGATWANLYQALKVPVDFCAWLAQAGRGSFFDDYFGTGADGTQASGFGTINMTRDMEWLNLSMSATDVINTAGFAMKVRNTFTALAGATINVPAWSAGFVGTIGAGNPGGAAQSNGTGNFGIGGQGGDGGNNGGSAGIRGIPAAPTWAWKNPPCCFTGHGQTYVAGVLTAQGVRGGGGGGGGGNNGGTGGAGGVGGGVAWIISKIVNATVTINVNGGDGAAGAGGNANGGGGGGGGAAVIVYGTKTLLAATVSANGGAGGAAAGSGAAGAFGVNGNTTIIEIAL